MKTMIEIQITILLIPPKDFRLCQDLKYKLRSILKGLCKYESSHEIFEGQVFDIANEENKLLYTLKAYIEEDMQSFIQRLKKEVDYIQDIKIPLYLENLYGTIITFELGEKEVNDTSIPKGTQISDGGVRRPMKKEEYSGYPTKSTNIAIINLDGENIEVLHSNTFKTE